MTSSSVSRTAADGIAFQRNYVADGAHYLHAGWLVVQGEVEIAGITEPHLAEPIDFEAEIEERRRSGVPIEPVDTDSTNNAFGI